MMGRLCYTVDDEGQSLSDVQLVSNVQFLLFAGYDTTKGSFCSFAYYLKNRPDILALLREEVATFSEPLNFDQLKRAPILNAFLAEVWRLVAPALSHNAKAATAITYKGYYFPKNTRFMMDIQANAVLDQDRYPDPLDFRLDRWIPEGHALHNPKYYAVGIDYNVMSVKYRPFNAGAHMCLGSYFAKLEARVVLTRLLQSYDIDIINEGLETFPLRQHTNDFKLTKRS